MVIVPIHVNPTADLPGLSPIQRYLFLLMLVTIKDRASGAQIRYEPGRSRVVYWRDGDDFDLEPLPEGFARYIGPEFRSLINPRSLNRSLADGLRRLADRLDPEDRTSTNYRFMFIIDPIWSFWDAFIVTDGDCGQVAFHLRECTDWAHEQAGQIYDSLPRNALNEEARYLDLWPNRSR